MNMLRYYPELSPDKFDLDSRVEKRVLYFEYFFSKPQFHVQENFLST